MVSKKNNGLVALEGAVNSIYQMYIKDFDEQTSYNIAEFIMYLREKNKGNQKKHNRKKMIK